MRSFDGQRSDNSKIHRNPNQLRAAIARLRADLAALRPHATPGMRETLQRRIVELEAEMAGRPIPPPEGRE